MEIKSGYYVEYKTKDNGFFSDYSDSKRALVSQEYLIKMLQNRAKYFVTCCRFVNVAEYQLNHEEKLEELGFDK